MKSVNYSDHAPCAKGLMSKQELAALRKKGLFIIGAEPHLSKAVFLVYEKKSGTVLRIPEWRTLKELAFPYLRLDEAR